VQDRQLALECGVKRVREKRDSTNQRYNRKQPWVVNRLLSTPKNTCEHRNIKIIKITTDGHQLKIGDDHNVGAQRSGRPMPQVA
jgi:pyruvate/2-oxoacid:ferredoxin oxidoreductase beta subunit